MTIATFQGEDDRPYQRWTSDHPDGFVITRRRHDYGLHKSGCMHIHDLGTHMVRAEKGCSDEVAELQQHAVRATQQNPEACRSCHPL